jgi:prevent-host-death family protein
MGIVSADEVKRRGISALAAVVEDEGEAVITVRGKSRFVVMTVEKYHRLRQVELADAVREARADYKAGRVYKDTVKEHLRRVKKEK